MALEILAADAPTSEIVRIMQRDGATIVADLVGADVVSRMTEEVAPYIEQSRAGHDDFVGRGTKRTGALVARAPTCRDLLMNPLVLGAAREFLAPYTERIIVHLTRTICIHPGQGNQPLHRDRGAWGGYIPRSIEPQFNTIWALTEFTRENGATRVVPGSQTLDDDQRADRDAIVQAEMSAGSVLLYTGSVLHSGGENRSTAPRLGLNLTYCLGWLRQEENQYLSCPPHIARTLDPELQDLLGYTQANYALGYYSDPDVPATDVTERAGTLPPEFALGRKPGKKAAPPI